MKKTKQRAVVLTIAILFFLSIVIILGKTFETTAKAGGYEGWNQLNGKWYYYTFDVKQTGWLKDNGVWYYLDPEKDGAMLNNNCFEIDGYEYCFTGSGRLIQNGWHRIKGGYRDGRWIKAYPSGVLIEGWVKEGSNWYYLNPTMVADSYEDIDNVYYFFHENGVCSIKQGWFQQIAGPNSYWYYGNQGGSLKIGWIKYYNKWYYLAPSMLTGGPREIDGQHYYFDDNGVCPTQQGWFEDVGTDVMEWFYRLNGGALKVGWLKYYNKWFYLAPKMLADGTHFVEENGKVNSYTFDENGVWIP